MAICMYVCIHCFLYKESTFLFVLYIGRRVTRDSLKIYKDIKRLQRKSVFSTLYVTLPLLQFFEKIPIFCHSYFVNILRSDKVFHDFYDVFFLSSHGAANVTDRQLLILCL